MLKGFILVAALLAVPGCSGDYYRRSADAQVYKLLAKRKSAVLDYQPDTQVVETKEQPVPKKAYETIPATPLQPNTPAPLVVQPPVGVPYGPLGPEARWIGIPVPEGSPQAT